MGDASVCCWRLERIRSDRFAVMANGCDAADWIHCTIALDIVLDIALGVFLRLSYG